MSTVYTDRSHERNRGVLIAIKHSIFISYHQVSSISSANLEAVAIESTLPNQAKWLLVCCYRPSDSNEMFDFRAFADTLFLGYKKIIMAGDFNLPNISWTDSIYTLAGSLSKNFCDILDDYFMNQLCLVPDRSIAESMNEYFISIGTKLADEIDSNSDYQNDDLTYANEFLESDSSSTNLFHFRTIFVISVALRLNKLLASKSTGMDNIPAKVLKITANIIAPSLTYIFNISLQSGIYVDDWQLAKIIPIYKSEDRKKCENYRPISILPVISKVSESEIFSQLYEHLNENTLLPNPCGFRPKYGTNAALLEMCDL